MVPSTTNDIDSMSLSQSLNFDTFRNSINGKAVGSKKHRNGVNPATRESLPNVPIATKIDLDTAVECARSAFSKWSQTPFEERKAAMLNYANALEKAKPDFVSLLTKEQGKPVRLILLIY
jgi:acyl-CoA reductase-like NAD-dependent aldehyde dehydrogenase